MLDQSVFMAAISPVLAQGAADAAANGGGGSSGGSLLQYVVAGGTVGYVIIMLSVVALGLSIAHFLEVRREKLTPPQVAEDLARLLRENDVASAFQYCAQEVNDSYLTRVFHGALRRCGTSPFGMLELRAALEESAMRQTDRLHRSTDAIGLIAAVCPMLGLLGTVFGMIGAFSTIGADEGATRSKELAGFMSLALVSTAQGLVVAIPCTAAFQFYKRRIDRLTGDAGDVIEQLAGIVEQSAGAPKPAPGAARVPAAARAAQQAVAQPAAAR